MIKNNVVDVSSKMNSCLLPSFGAWPEYREAHSHVWLQPPLIDGLGQLPLQKNTENANGALGSGVKSDEGENDLIFLLHILMYS